ncbi:MAG: hypothetical protein ACHREM_06695 [Polyangiales bacterium]
MRHTPTLAAALALLFTATSAHAEVGRGLEVAVAATYAVPTGHAQYATAPAGADPSAYGGRPTDFHGWYAAAVNMRVAIGWRVPAMFVGGYAQYGATATGWGCAAPTACDPGSYDTSAGVLADFHLRPDRRVDPWIGLSFGMEYAGIVINPPGVTAGVASQTAGWLGELRVGMDTPLGEGAIGGPYVAAAFGQFLNGGDGDHWWFSVGARVTYNP